MKKTFLTSKNREELMHEIELMKNSHGEHPYHREMPTIFVQRKNRIRITSGRILTFWNLQFDRAGEITISRCITVIDWFMALTFIAIDIAVAIIIFAKGFTINGALLFAAIVLFKVWPVYYLYAISPMKTAKRFVYNYLGGLL